MRSFGETPGKREALLNKLVKISETPVKREETPEKGEEPGAIQILASGKFFLETETKPLLMSQQKYFTRFLCSKENWWKYLFR